MNTIDLTPLLPRPSQEQYEEQAKALLKGCNAGDSDVLRRVQKYHPNANQPPEVFVAAFSLADAQLVTAREHGFDSWLAFARHIEQFNREMSVVSMFERAIDALIDGDLNTLAGLLSENPALVQARSTRLHRATLLHYVAANGLENYRQKSPANAVQIAKLLLESGADVDAVAEIYGRSTALSLVASSIPPRRAGVQLALVETLLEYGAAIDGIPGASNPVLAALRNGHAEAAEFLAEHGARLDLEGAAGVGRLNLVKSLKAAATRQQCEAGFLWACEYGRIGVMKFLLDQGIDVNADANTGLNGLHWAVVGGNLDAIRLLIDHGASLESVNKYGGTALGQALWSTIYGAQEVDHVSIVQFLLGRGAAIPEGCLTWLAEQKEGSSSTKEPVMQLLRAHRPL